MLSVNTSVLFTGSIFLVAFYSFHFYPMEEHHIMNIISVHNHSDGTTTKASNNLKLSKDKFPSFLKSIVKNDETNDPEIVKLKKVIDFEHNLQKNKEVYSPLNDIITEKMNSLPIYCIKNGLSLPDSWQTINISPLRKALLPGFLQAYWHLSLKDTDIVECANKINKNGLKDQDCLYAFFLVLSDHKFFVEDIQLYAKPLIDRIIGSTYDYKVIPEEYRADWIDINSIENTINNQINLLLKYTDFDINRTFKDEVPHYLLRTVTMPIFSEIIVQLQEKGIDSFRIIENLLNKKADPNKEAEMTFYFESGEPKKVKAGSVFKTFINSLCNKTIKCSSPEVIIEKFLQKKANPNLTGIWPNEKTQAGIELKSSFELLIDNLNENLNLFDKQVRNRIVELFIEHDADRKIFLQKASSSLINGNIEFLIKYKNFIENASAKRNLITEVINSYKANKDVSPGDWIKIIKRLLQSQIEPYIYSQMNEFPYEAILSNQPTQGEILISTELLKAIPNYFKNIVVPPLLVWLLCMKRLKWKMPVPLKKLIANLNGINDILELEQKVTNAIEAEWYQKGNGELRNTLRRHISALLLKWNIENPEQTTWTIMK